MQKNKKRQVYWHYTTLDRYTLIYRDRLITPATAFVIAPERPAVWFSCHPHWEPTANKGIMEGRLVRTATMDEMEEAGGGLVRIGVERRYLPHEWDGLPPHQRCPHRDGRGALLVGSRRRSKPKGLEDQL